MGGSDEGLPASRALVTLQRRGAEQRRLGVDNHPGRRITQEEWDDAREELALDYMILLQAVRSGVTVDLFASSD